MVQPEHDGAISEWTRMRAVKGARATVIDLYRLVAARRGLEPHQLPLAERRQLARTVAATVWPGFALTEGSERNDTIVLVEYDERWLPRFERWRDTITAALGPVASRIEHVGSTSVRGLPAKPIVDIQVSVADMTDESAYVAALEADVGVQLRSRDVLHRYFRPFPGQARDVHVHVCDAGSAWERDHLLFRDYLRRHGGAARRYAEAKHAAVRHWSDDGWAYTDAKTDAILDILEKAEAWAGRTGWAV